MADEVKAGDVFGYAATFTAQMTTSTTALEAAGNTASRATGMAMNAGIAQAGGNSFELEVTSLIDRARVADIKYNLDLAANDVLDGYLGRLSNSSLSVISAPRTPGQVATTPGGGSQNTNQPTTPGSSPQFIKDLAASLKVSESTAWLILFGSIGAVVMMVKK